jgi:Uma2 family endonuclease
MNTVQEIIEALRQLSTVQREIVSTWLLDNEDIGPGVSEAVPAYGDKPASAFLSVEEYLKFENNSDVRHEYVAGKIYAMVGVSEPHVKIVGNLHAALHAHLRGGPCRAYFVDFKLSLKVGHDDLFYYPDLMVKCGREGITTYHLKEPKLIIEVLSPSTERTDRREKALSYHQVACVEEYVLIAQNRPQIEFQRRADDWRPTVVTSLDSVATFHSIGLSLSLRQIYEDVFDQG